jgi:hypothetical protein
MLHPFSTSRLPRPTCALYSFLGRGYGIFFRTASLGQFSRRSPCANHVTHHFGKGITPARYCLSAHDTLLRPWQRNYPFYTSCAEWPLWFREDRQSVTTYRHARAKSECKRKSFSSDGSKRGRVFSQSDSTRVRRTIEIPQIWTPLSLWRSFYPLSVDERGRHVWGCAVSLKRGYPFQYISLCPALSKSIISYSTCTCHGWLRVVN